MTNAMLQENPFPSYLRSVMFAHASIVIAAASRFFWSFLFNRHKIAVKHRNGQHFVMFAKFAVSSTAEDISL